MQLSYVFEKKKANKNRFGRASLEVITCLVASKGGGSIWFYRINS
jgi:hypothetical protein